MPQLSFHTPLGAITVSEEDGSIVALDWGWGRDQAPSPLLDRARMALDRYFDGDPAPFSLPLCPRGTPYQRRVWAALEAIPFGSTCTYSAIAIQAGGVARSVGQANRCNPIPILIPCHRGVGAATIGGFSAGDGIDTKRQLLRLEAFSCEMPR